MSDVKMPNLQAVFGGNKITENKSVIEEQPQEIKQETIDEKVDKFEKILSLNINNLIEFKEHIFNEISENKFEELVESISQNGVLDPIIVRKITNDKYEIIAGHNRVRACKELKMQTVPATIKNVDDDTAKLIMIDTNINRRDKLLPSELMKAYSMKMEILKKAKMGQSVLNEENSTESKETREKIAEQENVSGRQITRYLRLKELIPDILRCVDKDCGGLLAYNYFSGEPVTGLNEGRPLFVRRPDAHFTLANFMRSHLYASLATLKIGLDILLKEEKVKVDRIYGHGGLFKTKGVGQGILAAAMDAPVAVMETAGEGGPWGMALLASYMVHKAEGETLEQYLSGKIFGGETGTVMEPDPADVAGFDAYIENYKKALEAEMAAVETMPIL